MLNDANGCAIASNDTTTHARKYTQTHARARAKSPGKMINPLEIGIRAQRESELERVETRTHTV